MSHIANALKTEIARVARKELKDEMTALRRIASTQRAEIAALKRDLKALTTALTRLQKATPPATAPADGASTRRVRSHAFSAEALSGRRASLGLTQAQMARVIGVSALSVYKWESGKVQPRAAQQAQIGVAMKLGKRAVRARLKAATA